MDMAHINFAGFSGVSSYYSSWLFSFKRRKDPDKKPYLAGQKFAFKLILCGANHVQRRCVQSLN